MLARQLALPFDSEEVQPPQTTKQGSQVAQGGPDARIASAVQAALGICDVDDRPVPGRHRLKPRLDPSTELLIEIFKEKVLARDSAATGREYAWAFRDTVRLASRLAGRALSVGELFSEPGLLRDVFANADSSSGDHEVSAWLTAHRRSVMRAFVNLMSCELAALGAKGVDQFLTTELRAAAEPIGSGYRLPVGATRGRGGIMPTELEARSIEESLGAEPGWHGLRNAALFAFLRRRGQRIGALLQLDGSNLYLMPDGTARIVIRAKSSREPSQLMLPPEVARVLLAYSHALTLGREIQAVSTALASVFLVTSGARPAERP